MKPPMSVAEIAKVEGVTRQRVEQIIAGALLKLRRKGSKTENLLRFWIDSQNRISGDGCNPYREN